jgi:hypothetical protein
MIRLFGGEVLDDPSQDFNITSGSDIQEDNTNLKIVISSVMNPWKTIPSSSDIVIIWKLSSDITIFKLVLSS